MTLIAAFRCEVGGLPGVIVCADSQETVGDYKVTVDKIKPRDAGKYDLIIGGSGNVAPLIDGLADAIERNIKKWDAGLDEESGRQQLERVLLAYHARHVQLYQAEIEDKQLRFVVCLRDKASSKIYLWKTDGTTAQTVIDYVLLGWEDVAYDYQVKWLYYPEIRAAQAVLLATNLFTVAKNSLYIGEPIQVIIVRDSGMYLELPEDVKELQARVEVFNRVLARLVFACPDTSISVHEFQSAVANFSDEAVRLHEHYIDAALRTDLERGWPVEPYIKYPLKELASFTEKHLDEKEGRRVREHVLSENLTEVLNRFIGPEREPERVAQALKIVDLFMQQIGSQVSEEKKGDGSGQESTG